MQKSLILDIDGVLIRDKKLLKHVRDNCVRYVSQKLPCCKNPSSTNDALYFATGHTGYGLSKILDIDTSDFNYKVYDQSLMEHLAEVISHPIYQAETILLHNLTLDGWDITLFTNAPPIWATPVALSINDKVNIRCPGYYKPSANAYWSFPRDQNKIYVEDSIKNLETIRFNKGWTPVYFGSHKQSWCPNVETIKDLYNFVREFDQKNLLIF
jgi:hypothetical protein